MTRFTYHAPLDPDCPDVRRFRAAERREDDAPAEEFERVHRAECERCHVHGAVHMEVREPGDP